MEMKYARGSEWRKWDLHVHTPESHGFIGDWRQFQEQLKQADCSAIGINDYFSIAGYEKIKNEIGSEVLDIDGKFILPVVEMRMTNSVQNRRTITNAATHFNFHVIFNPAIAIADIKNFIKSLQSGDTTIGADYNDKEKLKNKAVCFKETLQKLKGDSKFKDNFLVWLPYDEYGGVGEINPSSDGWIKSGFVKSSDILGSSNKNQSDFFLWKSELNSEGVAKFSQRKFADWFKIKKPCIKGSDSHKHTDTIGCLKDEDSKPMNKHCWIKADLTFEGLKQIIYEPEERVFIGEKPPILNKVENNKIKYLKSLEVTQSEEDHTGDIWFKDILIPFNNELIAIIGNKGSGKSGIADILGLLGDTHTDQKHFSFLHKNKFLKEKLASKFQAKIVWENDSKSDEVSLDSNLKKESPESVRFIPQNYFEELTNEIEINKFPELLANIIFKHIPEAERLGNSNFKDLENYKAENVNQGIQEQKKKIENINKKIIELERKKHPNYLQKIEGQISKKTEEINEQKKLLEELPTINSPNNNNARLGQQDDSIAQHNNKLEDLEAQLNKKENEKSSLTIKLEAIKRLKQKIEAQQKIATEFLSNCTEEANEYSLDINAILIVTMDYSSIDELISKTEKEINNINIYVEPYEENLEKNTQDNNESLSYKIKILNDKLKAEMDQLTGEAQKFQKNEQQKKIINEKIKKLEGGDENPSNDTLKHHEKEKNFIETDLDSLLQEKREGRIEISLEIFKKKKEIVELYSSFKKPVDLKINQNSDLLEGYDIKIDSSFNLKSNFYTDFLQYINQNKSGCFRGRDDGVNKIKAIVEDKGFANLEQIKILLISIINSLEENNAKISEQINEEKLNAFYNYLFSLGYIDPKYELKLGNKALGQLSPGERGALLLVFYLMIDKEEIPLIIDQPEDNLDNESVYNMLSKFIKKAKKNRQIIMVTHNPNLAVGADAEQIIHVTIDKTNKNKFSFISGSIENPEINKKIVQILEGTKPAFDKRKLKYQINNTN